MSSSKISLQGIELSKSFGSGSTLTPAVRQVSVSCVAGQFCLVMGPSGCGKSTLLAMLSGLLRPDRGQVLAPTQDIWKLSEPERRLFRLRHCGFIFQAYNLFPALTAREQLEMVLLWGEGASSQRARQQVSEMLHLLDLDRKGDKLPIQLSGGEKQRVAIGRALIKKPMLCFADEPTSSLDWGHGKTIVELLRERTRSLGATVVVVSHDRRLIPYADQVIYLDDGQRSEPPVDSGYDLPTPVGIS